MLSNHFLSALFKSVICVTCCQADVIVFSADKSEGVTIRTNGQSAASSSLPDSLH